MNNNDSTNTILIINVDRHVFYRDVYVFIDRLKNLVNDFIEKQRVKNFLFDCFRDDVFIWHFVKYDKLQKQILRVDNLKIWYITLKNRFKKRNFVVLLKLQIEKYTMTNARNDKISRVYVQNILRYAKFVNFFDSFNQMLMIWINFDIDFRVHIFESKFDTQFETFLNQFDEKTNIWRDLTIVKRSNIFVNNVDKNNRFINKQNQT